MSITGFGRCRSGVTWGTDARLVSGYVGGFGRGEAAEGAAGKGDPVGVVDPPVEDGIAKRGVADARVPVFDGQLTGDRRGAPPDCQ